MPDPELDPPQPIAAETPKKNSIRHSCAYHAFPRRRRKRVKQSNPPPLMKASARPRFDGCGSPGAAGLFSAVVCTPVWMVKVAVAAAVPLGVTDAGLTLHVAFAGAPEQVRLTC